MNEKECLVNEFHKIFLLMATYHTAVANMSKSDIPQYALSRHCTDLVETHLAKRKPQQNCMVLLSYEVSQTIKKHTLKTIH